MRNDNRLFDDLFNCRLDAVIGYFMLYQDTGKFIEYLDTDNCCALNPLNNSNGLISFLFVVRGFEFCIHQDVRIKKNAISHEAHLLNSV